MSKAPHHSTPISAPTPQPTGKSPRLVAPQPLYPAKAPHSYPPYQPTPDSLDDDLPPAKRPKYTENLQEQNLDHQLDNSYVSDNEEEESSEASVNSDAYQAVYDIIQRYNDGAIDEDEMVQSIAALPSTPEEFVQYDTDQSLLAEAICADSLALVSILLAKGVNIWEACRGKNGEALYAFTAMPDQPQFYKSIIDLLTAKDDDLDIDIAPHGGCSLPFYIARSGSLEAWKYLLMSFPNLTLTTTRSDQNALLAAITSPEGHNLERLQAVLDHPVYSQQVYTIPYEGKPLLHAFASVAHTIPNINDFLGVANSLWHAGLAPNNPDMHNQQPSFYATGEIYKYYFHTLETSSASYQTAATTLRMQHDMQKQITTLQTANHSLCNTVNDLEEYNDNLEDEVSDLRSLNAQLQARLADQQTAQPASPLDINTPRSFAQQITEQRSRASSPVPGTTPQ